MAYLTIGKVAKKMGVGVETIRYYERSGILSKPDRLPSGYRVYTEENIKQLLFLRKAQALGFTLGEISDLLSLSTDPTSNCEQINDLAKEKILQIEEKITILQNMRQDLDAIAQYCPANSQPISDCSIINHLYGNS